MSKVQIAIHGAAGRMGRRLVALAAANSDLQLVAAVEVAGHPEVGMDAGILAGGDPLGLPVTILWTEPVDVVIDFSVPDAAEAITKVCAQRNTALVLATTGLDPQQQRSVRAAAQQIPIVWAPNMSLAVNLTMQLAEIAARTLCGHPSGVDVEIIERHHRYKEDAPSGTALRFGEMIATAMGQTQHVHGRSGRPGPRDAIEIGYHAVRAGDHPGEHTIIFGLLGESIELHVSSTSRDSYAQGALAAAKFVASQPPGLYGMKDVLCLT